MIRGLYTFLPKDIALHQVEDLLKKLPVSLQERARRFKQIKDQARTAAGKLLLAKLLQLEGLEPSLLNDLQIDQDGRPFLSDEFDFNISHSGDLVICVFSRETRLGVDVELIREMEVTKFKKYFNEREMDEMLSAKNPSHIFFKMWTQKEAILKAIGKGLRISPLDIVINSSSGSRKKYDQLWYFSDIQLKKGYAGTIVCDKKTSQIVIERINFKSKYLLNTTK